MTKLNERVEKLLNGGTFEKQANVYIEEVDDYATANYYIHVVDPEELVDDLDLTDELNQLANKYDDDTELSDCVWNTVSEQLNSHFYDEPLSGVVSGE